MAQDINAEFQRLQQLAASLRKDFSSFNLRPVAEDASLISELLAKWEDELDAISRSSSDIAAAFRNVVQEISKTNIGINGVKKSFNSLTDIARQLSYQQQGTNKLTLEQIQKLKNKAEQEKINLTIQKASLETQKAQLIASNRSGNLSIAQAQKNRREIELINSALRDSQSIIDSTDENYKDLLIQLDLAEIKQKRVNEVLGLGGNAIKGMETVLNKMGLGGLAKAMGLDEVQKRMQSIAEEIEEGGGNTSEFSNKFKVLKGGIGEIGTQLKKSLSDPLVVIGFLVTQFKDAFLSLDTSIGNTAKQLGISYNEAAGLSQQFNNIANSSGNIFITTEGISESFNQINAALGTSANLSEELLLTQTELTKQAFYSAEAATEISKLSLATGKPAKDVVTSFLGQAKALNLVNNTAINGKQLLESISKTSKGTLATFAAQPGKLAEAAYQAKKVGLELNEMKGIQDSLLNIESSIASEFEAEVLTGKQLNLERARYYALTNNISGLSQELGRQGIDQAKFAGMNVLQQEAVAQAMGLSRDQLGEMLLDQAALSKLTGGDTEENRKQLAILKEKGFSAQAIAELGQEEFDRQKASASTQDKFNASVEKLKEVFVSLAEPLMSILGTLSSMLSIVGLILKPIAFLNNLIEGLMGSWSALGKIILSAAVAAGLFWAASTGGLAGLAIVATGAAVVGGILTAYENAQNVQDGIAPASKGPFTITDSYGATAITSVGDGLAVSPNINTIRPAGVVQQAPPQPTAMIDYDRLAQSMSRVKLDLNGYNVAQGVKTPLAMVVRK
jgi:hypothetical protein